MSTKAQRKMRRVAEQRGKQFALERSVLNAARALVGAYYKHRGTWAAIPETTWDRFIRSERALHDFHAERQRAASSATQRTKKS